MKHAARPPSPPPDAALTVGPEGTAPAPAEGRALGRHTAAWWGAAAVLLVVGLALHLTPANEAWMRWAHRHAMLPEGLWSVLTLLGFGWPLLILVCAADRGPGRPIGILLHAFWISALLTHLPKLWIASPRPAAVLPADALQVIGEPVLRLGSLPSGHALAATALLTITWFSWAGLRALGKQALLPLAVLAAGIAWSRVSVGAHWPADVLAGAGLGVAAGLLAVRAEAAWPLAAKLASLPGQRLVAALELAAGAAWLVTRTGYPQANAVHGALVVLAFTSGLWRWRCAAAPCRRHGGADRGHMDDPREHAVGLPPGAAL